jgi:hypothetical protein
LIITKKLHGKDPSDPNHQFYFFRNVRVNDNLIVHLNVKNTKKLLYPTLIFLTKGMEVIK